MSRTLLWVFGVFLAMACATLPPPQALTVAAEQSKLPTAQEAKMLAPQAFAHAERLRTLAEEAHDAGDREDAEILAEHALAAFQRATVQARLVKAKSRISTVEASLQDAEAEIARLARAQQATEAEAKALELRARVARDAEPIEGVAAASPAREAARTEAAQSIVEVARLLCLATRMLDSSAERVNQLTTQLDALDQRLTSAERPTPVDEAMTLRARCLETLTMVRRAARTAAPETDPADVLFTQLAQAVPEYRPLRDDRGLVVQATDSFTQGKPTLTEAGRRLLEKLLAVARRNEAFPLLIVLHGPVQRTMQRETAIREELSKFSDSGPGVAGSGQPVRFHHAGNRVPASVAPVQGSAVSAERIEFVLVAPQ